MSSKYSSGILPWIPAMSMAFLFFMALGGSIYTLVYFRHPDDKKGSWGAKLVIVVGLFSSIMGIFMLPVDVINRSGNGTVPMGMFWMVFCVFIVIQVIFSVPFMLAWYDSDRETFGSRLWGSFKVEFWVVGIFGLITGLCFYFYGSAKVPMQRLASVFVDPVDLVDFPISAEAIASATGFTCGGSVCVEGIKTFQEVNVSLAVYMIALMALFGWIFLVLFGGIGLITLPLDLIFAWKDRPVKIELEQYCKLRLAMKERSGRLLEFGKTLEAETSGRAMTIAQRNLFNKFKGEAIKAEADWIKVKTAYSGEGIASVIYPIQLGVGCLGGVISLMWILHLILYSCIKNARGGRVLTGFLNTAFVGGERIFPMITLTLYTIFTFWLLWCVLRGYTKIGLRAVAVPLFPLKKAGTYINSILVNTALVVCTSIAVITFCSFQLDGYLRLTAADMIFNVMLQHLSGLEPAWIVYQYLLFVVILLTIVYFVMFPKEASREEQLQADLEEMLHPTKTKKRCCGCVVS